MLLHAFPLNHKMWEPQIDLLAKHFRVIAPDIRGFGESYPPSPWTMDEMAADLGLMLDSLGVHTCAVTGVSMCGSLALSFWAIQANRRTHLVLSNTRARADNQTERSSRN